RTGGLGKPRRRDWSWFLALLWAWLGTKLERHTPDRFRHSTFEAYGQAPRDRRPGGGERSRLGFAGSASLEKPKGREIKGDCADGRIGQDSRLCSPSRCAGHWPAHQDRPPASRRWR